MLVLLQRIYAFIVAVWGVICNAWDLVVNFFRFCFRLFNAIPTFLASFPDWVLPICMVGFAIGLCMLVLGRR